jgi:hypothetical protein
MNKAIRDAIEHKPLGQTEAGLQGHLRRAIERNISGWQPWCADRSLWRREMRRLLFAHLLAKAR